FPAGTRTGNYALQSDAFVTSNSIAGALHIRSLATISQQNIGVPGGLNFPTTGAVQQTGNTGLQVAFDLPSATSDLSLTLSASRQALVFVQPGCGEFDTIDGRAQISVKDVI